MKKDKFVKICHSGWGCFVLVIITFLVYSPTLKNSFLTGWDDQWMVFSRYTEGGWTVTNLWHIFTDFYGGQYSPLAFLSYLALYTVFGYDPLYFHLFSLLLHIGCVCLVWKFITTLLCMHDTKKKNQASVIAWLTALLFAIHPINVEAVAWISALKVLLYAFFYLWGLLCYMHYIQTQKISYYVLAIVCFLCSFWGKEQAVTFPLVLLVIDWFANRNMKNSEVWSEKMSFLIMAFFFGIITILSQGKSPYEMTFPLYQRTLFGCFALVEYITKSLLPVNLNFFYPFPIVLGEELPMRYYLYPVVLLCITGWIIAYRNNRYLILGVLLFFINLLFSIHILNMSRHAIVADRYMYLSYIGVSFLIAVGLWQLKKRLSYFKTALAILFFYCFFLSVYTFHYTKKWENTTMVKKYTKEILEKRLSESSHL